MDWQTPAALGVVALTILLFLAKKKSSKSCGSDCACPKPGEKLKK